jgi:hypothetical protein
MRETIEKLTEEEKSALLLKYADLSSYYIKEHLYDPLISAVILDTCFKHLEANYKDSSKVAKAWAVTIVMRNYDDLLDVGHIRHMIEKFLMYYASSKYEEYCADIALWNNDFAKDAEFIRNYCSTEL